MTIAIYVTVMLVVLLGTSAMLVGRIETRSNPIGLGAIYVLLSGVFIVGIYPVSALNSVWAYVLAAAAAGLLGTVVVGVGYKLWRNGVRHQSY